MDWQLQFILTLHLLLEGEYLLKIINISIQLRLKPNINTVKIMLGKLKVLANYLIILEFVPIPIG